MNPDSIDVNQFGPGLTQYSYDVIQSNCNATMTEYCQPPKPFASRYTSISHDEFVLWYYVVPPLSSFPLNVATLLPVHDNTQCAHQLTNNLYPFYMCLERLRGVRYEPRMKQRSAKCQWRRRWRHSITVVAGSVKRSAY